MIVKRLMTAAFAILLGLGLAACSSFADVVADHWPHFAGGEPNGLPPRPGEPGYANFIAHGQSAQGTDAPAGNAAPAAAGQTAAISSSQQPVSGNQQPSAFAGQPQNLKPAAALPPAVARPSSDPSGGLY